MSEKLITLNNLKSFKEKSILNDVEYTNNLFDYSRMKKNVYLDTNNIEQPNENYSSSDYIQVKEGTFYVFSSNVRIGYYYDESKTLTGFISQNPFSYFTASQNGYIRFNLYNPVSPYFAMAVTTNLIVFNTLLQNTYIDASGNEVQNNSYTATDYIQVKKGVKYKLSSNARIGYYYDENKVLSSFISQEPFSEFEASNNGFIRLNLYSPVETSFYLVEETYIGKNEPYGYRLKHLLDNKDTSKDVKVKLFKYGNNLYFRSSFGDKDIIIRVNTVGSSNNSVNFNSYQTVEKDAVDETTSGTTFKGTLDDIAPVTVDGGYIGANHGNDHCYKVMFNSSHNLSESNIGEIWKDANNVNYLILKIVDTTNIIVATYNTETKIFEYIAPTASLTKGNTTLTISSASQTNLFPIENKISCKLFDENMEEIVDDGLYKGKRFTLCEEYNVVSPKGIYDYLVSNAGNNTNNSCASDSITDIYFRYSCTYQFTENGVVTLTGNYDIPTENGKKTFMVIGSQSETIGNYLSIPYSTFSQLALQNQIVNLEVATWTNADNPPNLLFQFSDSSMKKGFAVGYCPLFGDAKPSIRKNIYRAGYINDIIKKLYPYVTIGKELAGGDCLSFVAVRIPFNNFNSDFPAMSWYYQGEDIFVIVNCQTTRNGYLKMPNEMIGKKITVIEHDGVISCQNDVVVENGIKINCSNYGYILLKLS